MNHGLPVPVCLVDIIAVLLHLTVHGYQTLVVAACHTALISCGAAEIEHVPYMAGPDPRTLVQYLCHVLMIQSLISLAVVLACRIRSLVGDNALAAVLGYAKADIRVDFVEMIQPRAIILHLAAVPAKIVVVALQIGNAVHRTLDRSR